MLKRNKRIITTLALATIISSTIVTNTFASNLNISQNKTIVADELSSEKVKAKLNEYQDTLTKALNNKNFKNAETVLKNYDSLIKEAVKKNIITIKEAEKHRELIRKVKVYTAQQRREKAAKTKLDEYEKTLKEALDSNNFVEINNMAENYEDLISKYIIEKLITKQEGDNRRLLIAKVNEAIKGNKQEALEQPKERVEEPVQEKAPVSDEAEKIGESIRDLDEALEKGEEEKAKDLLNKLNEEIKTAEDKGVSPEILESLKAKKELLKDKLTEGSEESEKELVKTGSDLDANLLVQIGSVLSLGGSILVNSIKGKK